MQFLPNSASKSVTFYFTKANLSEGRSVARGLPLFVRDHYNLDPGHFFNGDFLLETESGKWNYQTRTFLSTGEKEEKDRLDLLEDYANAEVHLLVFKEQQKALAIDVRRNI